MDDRALLDLLVNRRDLPWTLGYVEDELTDVSLAGIGRLEDAGLLHAWDDNLAATHAAIYFYEAMRNRPSRDVSPDAHWRFQVLSVLLEPHYSGGVLESDVLQYAAHGRRLPDDEGRCATADALHRLERVGLVDRAPDGALCASAAAHRCAMLLQL